MKPLGSLRGKKVVVMGLGLHGGGLSIAQWLYSVGAQVVVTDLKDAVQLANSIVKLDEFCATYIQMHPKSKVLPVQYVLGEHRVEDFASADLVIKNPDVRKENQYLIIAQEHGVRIENEVTLLFLLTPHTTKIGITGTRGKSTTTTLVYDMVRRKYPNALLGGNIVVSTIGSILPDAIKNDTSQKPSPIVLELSSWQLSLLHELGMSPQIALFTNLLPDHLNRYADMAEYGEDKNAVHRYQNDKGIAIFNADNDYTREQGRQRTVGRTVWFSQSARLPGDGVCIRKVGGEQSIVLVKGVAEQFVCAVSTLKLPGAHNVANVAAAVAVARAAGISMTTIRAAIKQFTGIPHRMEYLTTIKGCVIYNDTTATTPVAACAALRTLGKGRVRKIVLIAGGADKKLAYDELVMLIQKTCRGVVLLSGTATPLLAADLKRAGYDGEVMIANSMEEAIDKAWRFSRPRDTILLSPACASFGMFINEFDRGERFRAGIAQLAVK